MKKNIVTSLREYMNENKYWSKNKIYEYKRFIKYYYSQYWKENELPELPLYKITTIGSYGTDKFIEGESDIDFMLTILAKIDKHDMIQILNYLNDKLIDNYGEIEGKGGKVEVLGINGELWFE